MFRRNGRRYRPVAQLVERRSPKPQVGGSRPSWPANTIGNDGNDEQKLKHLPARWTRSIWRWLASWCWRHWWPITTLTTRRLSSACLEYSRLSVSALAWPRSTQLGQVSLAVHPGLARRDSQGHLADAAGDDADDAGRLRIRAGVWRLFLGARFRAVDDYARH